MSGALVLALLSLAASLFLLLGRGLFWTCSERDGPVLPELATWPAVVAVIPARDEEEVIGRCVASLLAQDYPGPFRIIVVDDCSTDGTSAVVAQLGSGALRDVTVIRGTERPAGWAGKPWAMHQGFVASGESSSPYILFTDADIVHDAGNLRALVASAEPGRLVLRSQMVELPCESPAERLLVPAFLYFFQMLYPFRWVNDAASRTAAAAGGCMLIRRDALSRAGGVEALRSAIIDDCAMARLLKPLGAIRLTLTRRARSLRRYDTISTFGSMIARTAYVQLGRSPLLLLGCVAGLTLTFVLPVLLALAAGGKAALAGFAAWAILSISYRPTCLWTRRPAWNAVLLPVAASIYLWFTAVSAYEDWNGRGASWKGRVQASGE